MIERGLLILFAILAVAFSSEDPCQGRTGCAACKEDSECRWFLPEAKSEIGRCISKSTCKSSDLEDGKCLRNKKACPSCADHSGKGRGMGKCGRCLKSGCFWANDDKSCFDVCLANADCVSTPPPEKPEPRNPKDRLLFRSLLRFGSEADKMCFDFKIEDKNEMIKKKNEIRCKKAGRGKGKLKKRRGCETCLRQKLFVAPGTKPAEKFCKWFPDTGSCSPEGEKGEEYQEICDCKNKKREWPELVDGSAEDAKEAIERVCPKTHQVIMILEGKPTIKDFREDRVWIWHYKNQTVYQAPKIG